jgi:hypothetical protein
MAGIRAAEDRQATQQARFWKPLEVLAWRFTLSAALALSLLVAYGLGTRSSPPVLTTSQMQADGILEAQQPLTGDEVLLSLAESNHGK